MYKAIASVFVFALLTACGGGNGVTVLPSPADGVSQTPAHGVTLTHATRAKPYFKHFAALPDAVDIEDSDIDSNIESEIQGADRSALRSIMLRLRRNERKNVVLISNGRAIANHSSLLKGATYTKPRDGVIRLISGEQIAAPPVLRPQREGERNVLGGPIPPSSDDNITYWSERTGISLRLDANAAPLSPSYDAQGNAYPAATPTPMPKCGSRGCPL